MKWLFIKLCFLTFFNSVPTLLTWPSSSRWSLGAFLLLQQSPSAGAGAGIIDIVESNQPLLGHQDSGQKNRVNSLLLALMRYFYCCCTPHYCENEELFVLAGLTRWMWFCAARMELFVLGIDQPTTATMSWGRNRKSCIERMLWRAMVRTCFVAGSLLPPVGTFDSE